MHHSKAAIAGGGLAGLTCAKRLIDAGIDVELVEAESVFGGRATSWVDADSGDVIESGEHTFFGVYDRLTALLGEVGVNRDEMVTWSGEVAFLNEEGQYHTFGIDPLRSLPTVLAGVLGNNDFLGFGNKAKMSIAALRGLFEWMGSTTKTMDAVARNAGMDQNTIDRILRPLTRSLFFCEPDELAAKAFVDLLLNVAGRPGKIRAGSYNGGMGEVMIAPIVRWLQTFGATLRTDSAVTSIEYDETSDRILRMGLESGDILNADVFVSALPLEGLQPLISDALRRRPYFTAIQKIPMVPAISVQLWFDRKIVDRDTFTFLPNSSIPVFQDESFVTFVQEGSRISCQVTDRRTDGYSDQEYVDCAMRELGRFIPGLGDAVLERSVVVRHRAFQSTPEVVHSLRPNQVSPVPNFFIAGDFTDQNWYTTMEGAARSGEMAARAIVQNFAVV